MAAQTGLLLRNVRLIEELRARRVRREVEVTGPPEVREELARLGEKLAELYA